MKKIILTGGGTAGHVTPNIALLPKLEENGYEVKYIGSYNGIEKNLIEDCGLKYYGISTGKLRRYFDLKNFSDPFRVLKGFAEAKKIINEEKPDIIFSKGGFVSVPVVIAAARCNIPVIIHESDITPGLANKLSFSSATKICCNFPETVKMLPEGKAVLTGSPVREELFAGDKNRAKEICGFKDDKPVILVMGGSLGAVKVNEAVRTVLQDLLKTYNVIHMCGKGKNDDTLNNIPGYVQFEYVKEELKDLYALCDVIVSRAGANAICEIASLRKPNLLIPLSAQSSRGDQVLNAKSFVKRGFSVIIEEEDLNNDLLLSAIDELYNNRDKYINVMKSSEQKNPIDTIINLINEVSK